MPKIEVSQELWNRIMRLTKELELHMGRALTMDEVLTYMVEVAERELTVYRRLSKFRG